MFARNTGLVLQLCGQQHQQRGMATLKAISLRLKSVKNIQKITQSMKMVSAAKYARAERELKAARTYGGGVSAFYDKAEIQPVEAKPKTLYVAMSSDRGLCGAIHSSVCKHIRNEIQAGKTDASIVCVGDKSRAQLSRLFGNSVVFQVNEVGRKPATFGDAAKIANEIMASDIDYGTGKIVYNRFKSVVSYKTIELPLFSPEAVATAKQLSIYDSLDDSVLQSYLEYSLVSMIYYTMKEGACSEQSSRMTAMDGATKNAGEMIDKLTLTFNRTRQAVITGELIEIISGAAAL